MFSRYGDVPRSRPSILNFITVKNISFVTMISHNRRNSEFRVNISIKFATEYRRDAGQIYVCHVLTEEKRPARLCDERHV